MTKIRVPNQNFYHSKVYDQLLSLRSGYDLTPINECTLHLSILKNAHNWAVARFRHLNQTITVPDPNYLVLLREPIGRWITGISTYCRQWNILDEDYANSVKTQHIDWGHIFAKLDHALQHTLVLDGHTVPQQHYIKYYIKHVPFNKITLVSIHNQLEQTIDQLYNLAPYSVNPESRNATKGNALAEFRENAVREYMKSRDLTAQLMHIYTEDYQLLEQVCNPS